jgi:phage tail-like protein
VVSGRGTTDPPFVGQFKLEVEGVDIGRFTEVSGLSVQLDVEELPEGGQNAYTHRLLGRMKWPNLVFKRGLTDTDALFDWLMKCSGEGFTKEGNKNVPKDAKVSVLNAKGEDMRVWQISGALPVKWTGPKLAASSRELAVEELEVVHRSFRAQKKG